MVARIRERVIPVGPGYAARKIGTNPVLESFPPQNTFPQVYWWGRCEDVIGSPGADHPLTITIRDNRECAFTLNGHLDQGGGSYVEYKNYVPTNLDTNIQHLGISIPSVGVRATQLRARTNPSREEVSIPNFLYELKDLPGMIRNLKNLTPLLRNLRYRNSAALSGVASQYLGYEFGWKPLVSDISNLLQFHAQVDRRIQELNRLYSRKGLKRRLNLFDSSVAFQDNDVILETGAGIYIRAKTSTVTRKRSWGTIRWMPTAVPADIGRQDLGRIARRLVFGLQHRGVDAVQAWNALPFSWLADWFGNFGDWLAAHRNVVPAAPSPCNIMTLTETYVVYERTDPYKDIFVGGYGRRVLRTKERAQSSGSLSVHLPLASARQLGILSALNLQRKR